LNISYCIKYSLLQNDPLLTSIAFQFNHFN